MERDEHLDRQPPRDEAEEEEQDRLIDEGASASATDVSTQAPDPDFPDPDLPV